MKQIPLSDGVLALVDDIDYERIAQHKWRLNKKKYPARVAYQGDGTRQKVYMHREILGLTKGDPRHVDHRDGNPLNNVRSNLRFASQLQNNRNIGMISTNTSGFKGVSWSAMSKKWQVNINANGKTHYFGLYDSVEIAGYVAKCALKALHGEFANDGNGPFELEIPRVAATVNLQTVFAELREDFSVADSGKALKAVERALSAAPQAAATAALTERQCAAIQFAIGYLQGRQGCAEDVAALESIETGDPRVPSQIPAADSQDERAAFEADYAIVWNAAMTENGWNGGHTAADVKALREGNTYGKGRDYLNARWEGWQARAASPATATRKGGDEPEFVNLEGLRSKLLAPRETFRDDHGWLAHPDVPVCDEGTRVDKFLEAFGIETRFRSMESDLPDLHERWCDEGLDDCSEWTPTRPEGDGWLLLEIYDTEDGPYAMFGRDLFEAENARKREAHRAARAARNQSTGEAAE
jgi:hypothetical protein